MRVATGPRCSIGAIPRPWYASDRRGDAPPFLAAGAGSRVRPICGPDRAGTIAAEHSSSSSAGSVLGLAVLGLVAPVRRRAAHGVVRAPRRSRNVATLAAHGCSRSDLFIWHRYYIPSYTLAALVAGIGCEVLVGRSAARSSRDAAARRAGAGAARAERGTSTASRYRLAEDFSGGRPRHAAAGRAPRARPTTTCSSRSCTLHLGRASAARRRPDPAGSGRSPPPLALRSRRRAPLLHAPPGTGAVPGLTIVQSVWCSKPAARDRDPRRSHAARRSTGEDDPRVPKDYSHPQSDRPLPLYARGDGRCRELARRGTRARACRKRPRPTMTSSSTTWRSSIGAVGTTSTRFARHAAPLRSIPASSATASRARADDLVVELRARARLARARRADVRHLDRHEASAVGDQSMRQRSGACSCWWRSPSPAAREARERIIVLGLDGMDPRDRRSPDGRRARCRTSHGCGRTAPTDASAASSRSSSPIIWTTIATGKPPEQHGIGHFVAVNEQTGEQLPVTSQHAAA